MKINKTGLLPALEIVGYIAIFTAFIMSAQKFMHGPDPWWSPLLFLSLFCFSALTCVLIVFYKPYLLFIDKKQKEAGQLVLATTKWLGGMVLLVIAFVVMMSG